MKLTFGRGPHLVLTVCAVLTAGLLLWPPGSVSAPGREPQLAYAGPVLDLRRVSPTPAFPVRLAGSAARSEAPPDTHPAPALVGVAGGVAYLRSSVSSETERVARGGELDGWTLVSVGARAVRLRGASGERRLELFAAPTGDAASDEGSPSAGPTAAAGAAGP